MVWLASDRVAHEGGPVANWFTKRDGPGPVACSVIAVTKVPFDVMIWSVDVWL